MKIAFSFFLSYTHGVMCRFLGPHDTLPCVLILGYDTTRTQRHYARVQAIKNLGNQRAWNPFCSRVFIASSYRCRLMNEKSVIS